MNACEKMIAEDIRDLMAEHAHPRYVLGMMDAAEAGNFFTWGFATREEAEAKAVALMSGREPWARWCVNVYEIKLVSHARWLGGDVVLERGANREEDGT